MPDMPLSTMTGRFDVIFRLVGAGIIVVGIYLVLQPFLSALLVAGVLAIATWPLYRRTPRWPGRRGYWSAALMMLLILVLVVIPIAFLAVAAADQLAGAVRDGQGMVRRRRPCARTAEERPGHR